MAAGSSGLQARASPSYHTEDKEESMNKLHVQCLTDRLSQQQCTNNRSRSTIRQIRVCESLMYVHACVGVRVKVA